jgi:hypothetical protein
MLVIVTDLDSSLLVDAAAACDVARVAVAAVVDNDAHPVFVFHRGGTRPPRTRTRFRRPTSPCSASVVRVRRLHGAEGPKERAASEEGSDRQRRADRRSATSCARMGVRSCNRRNVSCGLESGAASTWMRVELRMDSKPKNHFHQPGQLQRPGRSDQHATRGYQALEVILNEYDGAAVNVTIEADIGAMELERTGMSRSHAWRGIDDDRAHHHSRRASAYHASTHCTERVQSSAMQCVLQRDAFEIVFTVTANPR